MADKWIRLVLHGYYCISKYLFFIDEFASRLRYDTDHLIIKMYTFLKWEGKIR